MFNLKQYNGSTPPSQMDFSRAVFWVQMHDLPLSCMLEELKNEIGRTMGEVLECDVRSDGTGWGKALRVIELNMTKPITRGRTLNMEENKLWIPFKYKKLPKLCFKCRVLSHGKKGCTQVESNTREEGSQFGLG